MQYTLRGRLDNRLEWVSGMRIRGMGMEGMRMGMSRGVEGMIYPPSGNEVPIPYNRIANLNTNTWV